MKIEPGMRVRCWDAGGNQKISNGETYSVTAVTKGPPPRLNLQGFRDDDFGYYAWRFKPVFCVKMGRG